MKHAETLILFACVEYLLVGFALSPAQKRLNQQKQNTRDAYRLDYNKLLSNVASKKEDVRVAVAEASFCVPLIAAFDGAKENQQLLDVDKLNSVITMCAMVMADCCSRLLIRCAGPNSR